MESCWKHCEQRLPLKWNSFWERSTFSINICVDFDTSRERSQNHASESTHLHVTTVFFLPSLSCNFDDQLSFNFHRFVILCLMSIYTTSLTITNTVQCTAVSFRQYRQKVMTIINHSGLTFMCLRRPLTSRIEINWQSVEEMLNIWKYWLTRNE